MWFKDKNYYLKWAPSKDQKKKPPKLDADEEDPLIPAAFPWVFEDLDSHIVTLVDALHNL